MVCRTVAAGGGNHQRGEKLMREDWPHFEKMRGDDLFFFSVLFWGDSFYQFSETKNLLSLMCPNTTGKSKNRRVDDISSAQGKAVKRGFVSLFAYTYH